MYVFCPAERSRRGGERKARERELEGGARYKKTAEVGVVEVAGFVGSETRRQGLCVCVPYNRLYVCIGVSLVREQCVYVRPSS